MLFEQTNSELLDLFNKRVYGHERAKKALLTLVARSRMRHYQKFEGNVPDSELIEPCKLLLIGDSGTGKTFMVEQLAHMLDFPLLKLDATQLEPSGGSKDKADQKGIIKLFHTTITDWLETRKKRGYTDSFDGAKERLVVFVDEIDKLACSFESSGNWNKHVQNSMLSIFDSHGDWAGVSFIFSGAFADMKREETNTKNGIGFNAVAQDKQTGTLDDDIVNHGLIPELVGRLTAIVELDKFVERDYRHIIYETLLPAKRKHMSFFGVECPISDKDICEIVKRALNSGQGVRFLKRELDARLLDIEFNYETGAKNELSISPK